VPKPGRCDWCRGPVLALAAIVVGGTSAVHGEAATWLSIKDFGARGDWNYGDRAGADDTAAIQRAIDHAANGPSESNVVYFPPGRYRVSATIRLPNWVRLRGDNGRNSQIHAGPGFSDPYLFRASNDKASMFNSRIEELWIQAHGNPKIRAVIKANAVLDALTGSFTKTSPSSLVTLDRDWTGFLSGRGLLPNGFDHTIRDERSGTYTKGTVPEIMLPTGR